MRMSNPSWPTIQLKRTSGRLLSSVCALILEPALCQLPFEVCCLSQRTSGKLSEEEWTITASAWRHAGANTRAGVPAYCTRTNREHHRHHPTREEGRGQRSRETMNPGKTTGQTHTTGWKRGGGWPRYQICILARGSQWRRYWALAIVVLSRGSCGGKAAALAPVTWQDTGGKRLCTRCTDLLRRTLSEHSVGKMVAAMA